MGDALRCGTSGPSCDVRAPLLAERVTRLDALRAREERGDHGELESEPTHTVLEAAVGCEIPGIGSVSVHAVVASDHQNDVRGIGGAGRPGGLGGAESIGLARLGGLGEAAPLSGPLMTGVYASSAQHGEAPLDAELGAGRQGIGMAPLLLPHVVPSVAVELATRAVYAPSLLFVSLHFRAMLAPRSTDWRCLLFNAIIPASPCLVFDEPGIVSLGTRNSVDIMLGGPSFEDREVTRLSLLPNFSCLPEKFGSMNLPLLEMDRLRRAGLFCPRSNLHSSCVSPLQRLLSAFAWLSHPLLPRPVRMACIVNSCIYLTVSLNYLGLGSTITLNPDTGSCTA